MPKVLQLQDALQWSIRNRIIVENFDHVDTGATNSKCAELVEALRPATALAWVEAIGLVLVALNVLFLGRTPGVGEPGAPHRAET